MFTENEIKEENIKVDNKAVESSSQEPMPSIWYT